MYFALGFLVAGLFMLMFLPAFWRRAMRLSMRRLQMLAPLSMEEVVAERDLLRAEFARGQRRMEQEISAVRAARTMDMVQIGRHAARIKALDDDLNVARDRIAGLDGDLRDARKLIEERTDLLASTENALHEMAERAERGVANLRNLQSDHAELAREKEAESSRVAQHEARIGNLHQQSTDLQRALERLQKEHLDLAQEADRLAGVDAALGGARADLAATRAERETLTLSLQETSETLAALEKRSADEIAHLEEALRAARAESRDQADRLETARADNAMLQGAVEALRKDHAEMREVRRVRESADPGPGDADVAALRAAIVDIGAKMARMEDARAGADAAAKLAV